MKKKVFLSLLIIISIFMVTGCGKKEEQPQEEPQEEVPQVKVNQELGWIQYYIPDDFTYQPDLRGLAYTDNDRKIYTKGDYENRNDVIIVDVTRQDLDADFDSYIYKINSFITGDNVYTKTSEYPAIYSRERYEGKVDDVVVYNYTYLTWYENFVYNISISGPTGKDFELGTLKTDILDTLVVGQ